MIEKYFIQNIDFDDLLENFLTSAIFSVLGIRIFLKLTNYPQLGGNGLHVAHVLWGGALMALSIFLLLTLMGRENKKIASILGGIGFGAFIDELGKFLTSDNNYFFKPTFSLIYFVFILIYLFNKIIKKYTHFSPKEYLVNGIDLFSDSLICHFGFKEKNKMVEYLKKSEDKTLGNYLLKYNDFADCKNINNKNFYEKIKVFLSNKYKQLIKQPFFLKSVSIFFIIKAIFSFFVAIIFFFNSSILLFPSFFNHLFDPVNTFALLYQLSKLIAGIFIIIGVIKMKKNNLEGYEMFKISLLISVFLVQFFAFYQNQLSAFYGLVANLLLLNVINFFIEREKEERD
jgi:hypothetical protein